MQDTTSHRLNYLQRPNGGIVGPDTAAAAQRSTTDAITSRVDLERCEIVTSRGRNLPFAVHPFRRRALLAGLDDIDATLERSSEISSFQTRDALVRPWVYPASQH